MRQTPMDDASSWLLKVEDLCVDLATDHGMVRAVDGVSFGIRRGKTLAVVGESGCGKSLTAQALLRLVQPPAVTSGRIVFSPLQEEPFDVAALPHDSARLYRLRGGQAGMVFQEASASLSPVHTIGAQLLETIGLHRALRKKAARQLALDTLDAVGIAQPALCLRQYMHELSGGMRQRVMIALALVGGPELLIADEPTTALDVTLQAQILKLLKGIQAERRMSLLLITHDLSVVAQMADEVAVMYMGRVVESGSVREILLKPRHPYTIALLASLPGLTKVGERLPSVKGTVPAITQVPLGCAFHPRCTHSVPELCDRGAPPPLEYLPPPSSPVHPPLHSDAEAAATEATARAVCCHRVREVALSQLLSQPPPSGRAGLNSDGAQATSPQYLDVGAGHTATNGPVALTANPAPSGGPSSSGFMSSVRPRATLGLSVDAPRGARSDSAERGAGQGAPSDDPTAEIEAAWDDDELPCEREQTRPLALGLALPQPGSQPPPHTERPEPFGRASQPPPAHSERPEPFSRASQPPSSPRQALANSSRVPSFDDPSGVAEEGTCEDSEPRVPGRGVDKSVTEGSLDG